MWYGNTNEISARPAEIVIQWILVYMTNEMDSQNQTKYL